jgi:hypothetical protein
MNKEDLKRALKEMSKKELMEVIAEMQDDKASPDLHSIDKTKKNRRRGKGGRKKKARSTKTFGANKGDKARTSRVDTSGNRPNKFEEFMNNTVLSGTEMRELEEATTSDKSNIDTKRSPRARHSSMVEVKCRICEKEETVASSLVHEADRYLCNSCCSRK